MLYKQPRGVSQKEKENKERKPAEVAVRVACVHAARHRARGMRAALGFLSKEKEGPKKERKVQ